LKDFDESKNINRQFAFPLLFDFIEYIFDTILQIERQE